MQGCLADKKTARRFQYYDGSAFGHALEGNLHIVFTQGFETQACKPRNPHLPTI